MNDEGGVVQAPANRRPSVTLESVAERAGVSRSTASRVLVGSSRVSEQARQAVLAAAAELSYAPNQAARSLVTRRSDALGFVVSESEERFFSDPFFAHVLRGAHAAAAERRRQLIFMIVATDDDRARLEEYAAGGHLDGAMFLSLHGDDPLPARVHRLGVPVVLAGRPHRGRAALPYVSPDNLAGGRSAAQVLLDRGCRHVATIAGPDDMTASLDRLAGFRGELEARGVKLADDMVAAGDFGISSGREAMRALLDRSSRVDGVFAANDLMAFGALQVAQERGLSVPDDLAVVGFDDVPIATAASPRLTTVRQPLEAMGRQMARLLLDQADGRPTSSVVLETELVIRDSA